MMRTTRRIKIGGLTRPRLFATTLKDDDEVKNLRLLFVTRSMMPMQTPDIVDLKDKLAKGRVTAGVFSESVKQLMVSGRYRLALDIYEKMISEDDENNHFSSSSVLNDTTLLMLVHCHLVFEGFLLLFHCLLVLVSLFLRLCIAVSLL